MKVVKGRAHMFPWNIFPFNNMQNDFIKQFGAGSEGMEKYMQNLFSQVFSNEGQTTMGQDWLKPLFEQIQQSKPTAQPTTSIHFNLFETFDEIIVRIEIKDEEWLKNMKIYHTTNKVMIENIPEIGDKEEITLPSIVRKKGAVAIYKDGIVEMKIVKGTDMQYTEVGVMKK